MQKILSRLQKRLTDLPAEYADLRLVETDRLKIRTKKGGIEEVRETFSRGVGFRVLAGGTFGFSSTHDLSEKSLASHLDQAYRSAKEFSKIRHAEVKLARALPVKASWTMPIRKDPWKMSTKEKAAPLLLAGEKLAQYRWIDTASGLLDFTRKRVTFISNEGGWIEQTLYRTGGWIYGEARIGRSIEKVRRSFPGPTGVYRAQGFETIEAMNFQKEAPRLAEELKSLRHSNESFTGTHDLILKGSILALQIHETFGHASESDRVLGYEDNYGGRTFLNPGFLGGFSVASEKVSLANDATLAAGPGAGSFAYDDEGVKARRTDILRNGVFIGYLTSRETANFLNQPGSTANMVALDWSNYPLIRMTNTSLLPGKGTLAEMIADTKDGILLDSESSWSIDEMRLDFQIGAEAGYKIQNGKIRGLVRLPFYHGNSLDFWRACDGVAGKKEWEFFGFADCGKGGPYQEAFTGHGVSPARFRKVEFGRE